jgi:hypothetical protein
VSFPRRTASQPDELWPPEADDAPVNVVLARLGQPADLTALSAWADGAQSWIAETLRSHLIDVDATLCGSVATETTIGATTEADVVVRIHAAPDRWREDARIALQDVWRWLAAEAEVQVVRHARGIVLNDAGLSARALVCVRPFGGGSGLIAASPSGEWRPMDPAGHRDLVRARDASIGRSSRFTQTIRIIKALHRAWSERGGRPLLSSFQIDGLALAICRRSLPLADMVTNFCAAAARLVTRPIADPLAIGPTTAVREPALVAQRFSSAQLQIEQAAIAVDADEAAQLLEGLAAGRHSRSRWRSACADSYRLTDRAVVRPAKD